jgi:hypothetical protein
MDNFKLIVEAPGAPAALVGLLRCHTGMSFAQIRQALVTGAPVMDVCPHHNVYDEFIEKTLPLLSELEDTGYPFRLIVDGVDEDLEYVRNVFDQWSEIGEQIQEENDRAFGDSDG